MCCNPSPAAFVLPGRTYRVSNRGNNVIENESRGFLLAACKQKHLSRRVKRRSVTQLRPVGLGEKVGGGGDGGDCDSGSNGDNCGASGDNDNCGGGGGDVC